MCSVAASTSGTRRTSPLLTPRSLSAPRRSANSRSTRISAQRPHASHRPIPRAMQQMVPHAMPRGKGRAGKGIQPTLSIADREAPWTIQQSLRRPRAGSFHAMSNGDIDGRRPAMRSPVIAALGAAMVLAVGVLGPGGMASGASSAGAGPDPADFTSPVPNRLFPDRAGNGVDLPWSRGQGSAQRAADDHRQHEGDPGHHDDRRPRRGVRERSPRREDHGLVCER